VVKPTEQQISPLRGFAAPVEMTMIVLVRSGWDGEWLCWLAQAAMTESPR
jgi:hypothetical protein